MRQIEINLMPQAYQKVKLLYIPLQLPPVGFISFPPLRFTGVSELF